MANIQPKIVIELDPRHPVPEICAVISAVLPYHPGQEAAILQGVTEAIEQHMKGVSQDAKQVHEHRRERQDQ
ncbi:hypothetical protein KIH86_13825 [Paenibacillus sp. HN-1]|uniref:hypothetical protein n=1 Tax=Paenibacillus TaxID=44249 RepID=UPI001CA993B9|nr:MULTISPECIES: hypothetical protein [Paenibacillus]MBY9082390.1 hypothetical protein [Paenibacillus sp. CGMCC 1.18879]MBY9085306.1 hypothetical protein [Paenibacillus sinensis]